MPTNQIIEVLGLTFLDRSEIEDALHRICNDSLVQKRAQTLAINQHIVSAIQALHPAEKDALIKRVTLKVQSHDPHWSIQKDHDENGDFFVLTAQCPIDHFKTRWFAPPLVFSGAPWPPTRDQIEKVVEGLSFRCGHGVTRAPDLYRAEWKSILETFFPGGGS